MTSLSYRGAGGGFFDDTSITLTLFVADISACEGATRAIRFAHKSGTSFAPQMPLSWWLGFRIRKGGWSKSLRLGGRNPHGARRDKIPGDLSSQELALLGSMPIPGSWI